MSSYPCCSAAAFVISTIVALCWHVILSWSLFLTFSSVAREDVSVETTVTSLHIRLSLNHSLRLFCFNPFLSPNRKFSKIFFPSGCKTILKYCFEITIQWSSQYTVPNLRTCSNHWEATHPLDCRLVFDLSITCSVLHVTVSLSSFSFFPLCPFLNISFLLASSHPHHPCGAGDISESGDQTHSLTHTHTHTYTHSLQSSSWSLRQY